MSRPNMSREEIEEFVRRGQDYYDLFLRDKLEPEHDGKYLVLDVETGDYEMDAEEVSAILRAHERMPDKIFYTIRVGYPTADRIGARDPRSRS